MSPMKTESGAPRFFKFWIQAISGITNEVKKVKRHWYNITGDDCNDVFLTCKTVVFLNWVNVTAFFINCFKAWLCCNHSWHMLINWVLFSTNHRLYGLVTPSLTQRPNNDEWNMLHYQSLIVDRHGQTSFCWNCQIYCFVIWTDVSWFELLFRKEILFVTTKKSWVVLDTHPNVVTEKSHEVTAPLLPPPTFIGEAF